MDKRKFNGGHKTAGRKSKSEERELVEKLTPLAPSAFKALEGAINKSESWAVKMFFEYMYGKPKQIIESINTNFNKDFNITDIYKLEDDSDKTA